MLYTRFDNSSVVEDSDRKAATGFRNFLLDQGFEMAQFSVYMRFCSGPEHTQTYTRRIKEALPLGGKVDVLFFTDKQYENILSFRGHNLNPPPKNPDQFVLF